mmetsp:Transcript_33169/g.76462  ORF Transcript_33169/g.76462 Transcript_33169/m.76462 type:complete len:145 (-) Transcript_33169:1134-1568(-)
MVHQLLAGVHIATAAEALALAAKANLDIKQMYDIVVGAAGNSWMFGDRGKRMIAAQEPQVMSAIDIFVKAREMRCYKLQFLPLLFLLVSPLLFVYRIWILYTLRQRHFRVLCPLPRLPCNNLFRERVLDWEEKMTLKLSKSMRN